MEEWLAAADAGRAFKNRELDESIPDFLIDYIEIRDRRREEKRSRDAVPLY
jgi:hypothetical protein